VPIFLLTAIVLNALINLAAVVLVRRLRLRVANGNAA